MKKVAVFKTNVTCEKEAQFVCSVLSAALPDTKINFDLDDCDNILRVEGVDFSSKAVQELVQSLNYLCEKLE